MEPVVQNKYERMESISQSEDGWIKVLETIIEEEKEEHAQDANKPETKQNNDIHGPQTCISKTADSDETDEKQDQDHFQPNESFVKHTNNTDSIVQPAHQEQKEEHQHQKQDLLNYVETTTPPVAGFGEAVAVEPAVESESRPTTDVECVDPENKVYDNFRKQLLQELPIRLEREEGEKRRGEGEETKHQNELEREPLIKPTTCHGIGSHCCGNWDNHGMCKNAKTENLRSRRQRYRICPCPTFGCKRMSSTKVVSCRVCQYTCLQKKQQNDRYSSIVLIANNHNDNKESGNNQSNRPTTTTTNIHQWNDLFDFDTVPLCTYLMFWLTSWCM